MSKFKVCLLIPYFGQFPEWANLYFETIRCNPTINFIFYTDCDTSQYNFPNVVFKKISFNDYINYARQKANIEFNPANAYKLCDLRPLYPIIHNNDIKHFDFYGWTDMDILFGDIRSFYSDDILEKYDVISTHSSRVSGHLALFRNTSKYRNLYLKIYNWRSRLAMPHYVGLDESGVTNALVMTFFDKLNEKMGWSITNYITQWFSHLKKRKLYLVEQYTTPFTPIPWLDGSINSNQPTEWYYRDGIITNECDGTRKFIYLHLMNFKNSQWRHDGTKAPWEGKEKICFANKEDMNKGLLINSEGIHPI